MPTERRSRLSLLPRGRAPAWLLLGVTAALLALVALGAVGLSLLNAPAPARTAIDLVPQAELDRRWGSYLSERSWGNPREAIGSDGWGLSWRGAIDTEYQYGDDGIAGMSDLDAEFRLGWAFWDGSEDHVTERFRGFTNPEGPAGEAIIDDRVFQENGPTHAYQRMTYRYPSETREFTIELESARFDSTSFTMAATVTNSTAEPLTIDVVFKGWVAPGGSVDPVTDGLLLIGTESVVAVVGQPPSEWQITGTKAALDQNLRTGGLVEDQGGHIGALAYRLELPAGGESVIRLGAAESPPPDEQVEPVPLSSSAEGAARAMLARSDAVMETRRQEADGLFRGAVTEHEELYRQALMSLLWSESHYRWDGASGVNPRWSGLVDANEVLLLPDKWEFPWLASWDSAFHTVTASLVDPQIAHDQLRFILSDRWQQPDGHIPCAEWVMDIECPPVFAWAAWRVFESSHDRAFLEDVYPGLQRNYDYWWQANHIGNALFTGGFLGMDNLPRGPTRSAQADATAWMALFAREMAVIASELGDPQTSERYWVDRGRIQEAINTNLWDEASGFYYDLASGGRLLEHKSYSGLIPLIAGVVPDGRLPTILGALRDEAQFMSGAGIRSLSQASALYTPGEAGRGVNSNWRGPVWVPINYMLVEALSRVDPSLAADIRLRVVETVERDWRATGRFHEFYDGDTGQGLGADAQTGWTALVANLIREGWPATPPP